MKRGQFLIASLLALTLTLILFSINASDASAAEFTYIYLGNMLLERVDSLNNEVYFSQDSIGNNRIITDSSQNLIEKQDLELFGNKIAGTGSNFNSKLKFTGKERDSSGYDYFGARYYDSSLGRFISVDPIFNPTESSYSYAKNNPIKFVDPTGNQATAAALQQTAINVYEYLNYILPQTPPNIRPFIGGALIFAGMSVEAIAALSQTPGYQSAPHFEGPLIFVPAPQDVLKPRPDIFLAHTKELEYFVDRFKAEEGPGIGIWRIYIEKASGKIRIFQELTKDYERFGEDVHGTTEILDALVQAGYGKSHKDFVQSEITVTRRKGKNVLSSIFTYGEATLSEISKHHSNVRSELQEGGYVIDRNTINSIGGYDLQGNYVTRTFEPLK